MTDQAQCPECLEWSPVEWQVLGWWWRDSGCCPKCDAPVCVETECEFRTVKEAR